MATSTVCPSFAQYDPAAIIRGLPSHTRVTTNVNCECGLEKLHKAAMLSEGGGLSEKNQWRLDSGDNRSTNCCIIGTSVGSAGRIAAVVPSRMMREPDSV